MISSKRLAAQMARKWLGAAAAGRKRIALFHGKGAGAAAGTDAEASDPCSSSSSSSAHPAARKGCFVVYCCDGQRVEVPLACLKSELFGELLRVSEELLGLPGAAPITLPCDAAFVRSVVSCLRRRSSSRETGERAALLASLAALSCSAALAPSSSLVNPLPQVVCGY